MPARIFINVLFPAPFGPNKPKISPSFTSKFKLFNALIDLELFLKYILLRFLIEITFCLFMDAYRFITLDLNKITQLYVN